MSSYIYYDSEDSSAKDAKVIEKARWELNKANKIIKIINAFGNKHLINGTYRYIVINDCIQISFPREKGGIADDPIYYEKMD